MMMDDDIDNDVDDNIDNNDFDDSKCNKTVVIIKTTTK